MKVRVLAFVLALTGSALALQVRAGELPVATEPAMTATGTATDGPGGIEVGWSVGYDSHYIFRGELLQKSTLWTEVAVDVLLTEKLSLNLTPWALQDADDDYNEVDLTGTLTLDFDPWEISAGFAEFYYPRRSLGGGEGIRDEQEVSVTVSRGVGALTATVLGAYNVNRQGFYFEAAAEYEVALTDTLSLTPSAVFGVDTDYFDDGFDTNHAGLTLTAAYKPLSWFTLCPYVAGTFPLGHLDTEESDAIVFGGIKLTATY